MKEGEKVGRKSYFADVGIALAYIATNIFSLIKILEILAVNSTHCLRTFS